MKVVFMGTPDFSVPALQALIAAGHDICAVYTQPPRPAGRGQKEQRSAVHDCANQLGLPVRTPLNFKAKFDRAEFAALNADVAVVVAYGLLLPQAVLDMPRLGCLNIHASLLPRWRGAAPIHRAILHGDEKTGVCIIQMEAGLDTGPVLQRVETQIGPDETTAQLHNSLANMGAKAIVDTLSNITGLTAQPQDNLGITYAKKIDKAETRIDWGKSADEVSRQIRALSPFPGAWCEVEGQRLKLLGARAVQGNGPAGSVLFGTAVACGTGAVEITQLQRSGKRSVIAAEFLRGARLPERLG